MSDLPIDTFQCMPILAFKGRLLGGRPALGLEGIGLIDPVLDATPLCDADYATVFAYMHRRFGMPNIGGDNYKDLSAGWLLSTPDADLILRVSPSVSGAYFTFMPMLRTAAECAPSRELTEDRRSELLAAYRAGLLDLLRPVTVRDCAINALGLVDCDTDPVLVALEVPQHESCGTPMPAGIFGGEDWQALMAILGKSDVHDRAAGLKAVVASLQDAAIDELLTADWAVQRLVILAASERLRNMPLGDKVPEALISRAHAERDLIMAVASATDPAPAIALIDEVTDEAVLAAAGLLRSLGLPSSSLHDLVRHARLGHTAALLMQDLMSICDRFPLEVIKEPLGFDDEGVIGNMRASLISAGRDDLVAWMERCERRPLGRTVLVRYFWHLEASARSK